MNQKTAKRVRKEMRKISVVSFAHGFNEACDQPFRVRMRFIWRLITGRGVQR